MAQDSTMRYFFVLIAAWGYGVAFPALAIVIALSAVMFAFVPKVRTQDA